MKIGVTGAAGYIGSRLMKIAIESGHEVIGIDNFYLGQIKEIDGNKIINANIEELEKIEPILKDCDVILHLAAISGVEDCKNKPNLAYNTNIVGTQNITWICKKHEIPLVFVSSMAIFGDLDSFPIKESDNKDPLNLYGLTKLIGMENVRLFSKDNFPSYIFILSNVYGNHWIEENKITKNTVINLFLEKAKDNKTLPVYKPGTHARNFIHVKEVARTFLKSVKKLVEDKKKARVFNLASDKSYSIIEIAEIIKKTASKFNYKTKVKLVENPRNNETLVKDFSVDISKIKKHLNFNTKITVNSAITRSFK